MDTCCACQDCQVELPGLKSHCFISLCTLNTVMISPRNDKWVAKIWPLNYDAMNVISPRFQVFLLSKNSSFVTLFYIGRTTRSGRKSNGIWEPL